MSNTKYISGWVCGRPEASAGFQEMVIFNGPGYQVQDVVYGGVDVCSLFYSVKIDEKKTIYQLIKNNVRSNASVRKGNLVISFSVPKGYRVKDYSPYDVLNALKDDFLTNFLVCVDPKTETYEFLKKNISTTCFDELIKKYPLEEHPSPHRSMQSNGMKGCLRLDADEIREFLKDVQYAEFAQCGELIIAESFSGTSSYIPFNGLQIPRIPSYEIFVDGGYRKTVTDTAERLSYCREGVDKKYYTCEPIEFSVKDILDRESLNGSGLEITNMSKLSGIKLDAANERVYVTTPEPRPVERGYQVAISPVTLNDEVKKIVKPRVKIGGRFVDLDSNWNFKLYGKDIESYDSGDVFVEFENSAYVEFEIAGWKCDGGRLTLNVNRKVHRKQNVKSNNGMYRKGHNTNELVKPVSDSIVYELDFSKCKILESGEIVKVKVEGENNRGEKYRVVQPINVSKDSGKKNLLYISKEWAGLSVALSIEDESGKFICTQYKILPSSIANDEVLRIDDSLFIKKSLWARIKPYHTFVFMAMALLVGLILGGGGGYIAHDPIEKMFVDSTQDTTSSADSVKVGSNDNEEEDMQNEKEENARIFLTNVEDSLKAKELKFEDVVKWYNQYINDSTLYRRVDNKGVLLKLKAYNTVVEWIKQGGEKGYNSLNSCAWMAGNNEYENTRPHLNEVHQDQLTNYFYGGNDQKREQRKTYFLANHSSYNSFDDLIYKEEESSSPPDRTAR